MKIGPVRCLTAMVLCIAVVLSGCRKSRDESGSTHRGTRNATRQRNGSETQKKGTVGRGDATEDVRIAVRQFISSLNEKKGEVTYMELTTKGMQESLKQTLYGGGRGLGEDIDKPNLDTLRVVTMEGTEAHCRLLNKNNKWFNLYLAKPGKKWLISGYSRSTSAQYFGQAATAGR